jgi:hypothetical protein
MKSSLSVLIVSLVCLIGFSLQATERVVVAEEITATW